MGSTPTAGAISLGRVLPTFFFHDILCEGPTVTTIFLLQYRDAASDQPLMEFTAPLPIPVPRRGERVALHQDAVPAPLLLGSGIVDRVEWAYLPVSGEAPHAGFEGTPFALSIQARVWLTLDGSGV